MDTIEELIVRLLKLAEQQGIDTMSVTWSVEGVWQERTFTRDEVQVDATLQEPT